MLKLLRKILLSREHIELSELLKGRSVRVIRNGIGFSEEISNKQSKGE